MQLIFFKGFMASLSSRLVGDLGSREAKAVIQ